MTRNKWLLLGLVLLALPCCLLLLPCPRPIRDGEARVQSAARLRYIGEALRLYHETNGRLPPAVVRGKDGEPLYSWRVLLLPYLEHEDLFQRVKLDEPWDGPHNKPLLEMTPRCYVPFFGGNDAPGLTRYQVFVGPGTAFERDGLTWDDFPDGLSNTLLVVEAGEPVPWAKPADLACDPDRPLPPQGGIYTRPVHFLCWEVGRRPGFNACFADGSTQFIGTRTDGKTLRKLITRNGGEQVDRSRLD